jgi:hypothetical protein
LIHSQYYKKTGNRLEVLKSIAGKKYPSKDKFWIVFSCENNFLFMNNVLALLQKYPMETAKVIKVTKSSKLNAPFWIF